MGYRAVLYMLKHELLLIILDLLCLGIKEKGGIFYEPNTKKIDLVVIRINKNGDMCNSRPCYNCLNMMRIVNIRKVYYSVNATDIICESVKDMISIQISSVSLHLEKLNHNIKFINNNTFYEYLLHKLFPKEIKKRNLESFIKYNLNNVLPDYKTNINNNNIEILNTNNEIVITSFII